MPKKLVGNHLRSDLREKNECHVETRDHGLVVGVFL